MDKSRLMHFWIRQSVRQPIFITGGKGCYLEDITGEKYLDFISGEYNVALGHQNGEILASMCEQITKMVSYSLQFAYVPQALLGQRLLEKLPQYGKVSFQCNGTDAVELAAMIVRQVSERKCIISQWLSYHGSSREAFCIGGWAGDRHRFDVASHVHVPPCYCYRCFCSKLSYPECSLECAHFLENTVKWAGANQIAAVIIEPMLGSVVNDPPIEYLKFIEELCQRHNILFVLDEIMTGLGRTGKMFCLEHSNILPDMLLLGKSLTSGYAPLSAAVLSKEIAAFYENVPLEYGLTYGGNPLSCATALATLKCLENHKIVENAEKLGIYLKKRLQEMQIGHPCVGEVRGRGLLLAIELVKDRKTRSPFTTGTGDTRNIGARSLRRMAREKRLIVGKGSYDNVLLCPPLTITKKECDVALDTLGEILSEVDNQVKN